MHHASDRRLRTVLQSIGGGSGTASRGYDGMLRVEYLPAPPGAAAQGEWHGTAIRCIECSGGNAPKVRIGDVAIELGVPKQDSLVPAGYRNIVAADSQETLQHLMWIMQKDVLGQVRACPCRSCLDSHAEDSVLC